jgi:hypothetical protein
MNPILSIIIDKLAFVAVIGGLASLPDAFPCRLARVAWDGLPHPGLCCHRRDLQP